MLPPQLLALLTSVSYATALVAARAGLRYSTPPTVTCVSVIVQVVVLWSAVFATGGIPRVSAIAVALFVFVGLTQLGVRLFAYSGVAKIGASRSGALQGTSPLIAALIAIVFLGEPATASILAGTLLVAAGIALLSWREEEPAGDFRWWHLLLPLGAAFLTGINHPIRRYALSLSNEPLFFATLMGTVSLAGFVGYAKLGAAPLRLVWHPRALGPFLLTGLAETFSILGIITALSVGRVTVVAPIAATYPLWALLESALFLRRLERVSARTVAGSLSIVCGIATIHLQGP